MGVLILIVRAPVLKVSSDLAYSVVLAALTAGYFTSVFLATWFSKKPMVGANHGGLSSNLLWVSILRVQMLVASSLLN